MTSENVNLDPAANRAAKKYGRTEMLRRVAWMLMTPFFRYSPRPCFGWRRLILRLMGATVGARVHVYPSAKIYYPWMLRVDNDAAIGEDVLIYNLGLVTIGKVVTISHRAHLCAGSHDYCDPTLPLLRPPITIGDEAWICSEAFVGPGTIVGEGAVVGARAVVLKDIAPWQVVVGNPAKSVKRRELRRNEDRSPSPERKNER